MNALIDTCVIIDALQKREPFWEDAADLFLRAANRQFVGYITAKSATDIYYLTHRQTHSDSSTREILTKLFQLFEIADTAAIDCKRALSSDTSDFEDGVMIETALRIGADCIITRNIKDYKKVAVDVLEPAAFLQILQFENNL